MGSGLFELRWVKGLGKRSPIIDLHQVNRSEWIVDLSLNSVDVDPVENTELPLLGIWGAKRTLLLGQTDPTFDPNVASRWWSLVDWNII